MNKKLVFAILSVLFSTISSWALDFSKLNLKRSTYYVKIGGTGDGSSWENALGNTDFNYVVANAQEGVTFHIAAGKYIPVLNKKYDIATELDARYEINGSATLIGGYPENPSDNDVNDPSKYKTIFTTDVKGDNIPNDYGTNRSDDMEDCLIINCKDYNASILLYGITFEGCPRDHYSLNSPCTAYNCNLDVQKCKFSGCLNGIAITKCNATLTDCTFEHNNSAFVWTIGNINIDRSTFYNNSKVTINPSASYSPGGTKDNEYRTINVSNSTFYNNHMFTIAGKKNSELNFTNNTISMVDTTLIFQNETNVSLVGNIINVGDIISDKFTGTLSSKYNYYRARGAMDDDLLISSTDKKSTTCSFLDIRLKNNGGYTETIALLDDKLSDGYSLRFPRSICGLNGDQRKMKRAESTCIGAYELGATIPAPTIRKPVTDTILIDRPYYVDNKHHPIGHDTIVKAIKDINGNDSIISTYYLYVYPSWSITDYYVTKNGSGDKSGLSWENAMNESSFAYAIGHLRNGSTLHIAEGIYRPMYDKNDRKTDVLKNRIFYTESAVNLIGGYSEKNPEEGPNPNKYKTILSGKYNRENVDCLLSYSLWYEDSIKISGIKLINANTLLKADGIKLDDTEDIDLDIENCVFENAKDALSTTKSALQIKHCSFNGAKGLTSNVSIQYDGEKLTSIENSSFVDLTLNVNCNDVMIKNNTISSLTLGTYSPDNLPSVSLYNNTIGGAVLWYAKYDLIGNLFAGGAMVVSPENVKTSYNIYNALNSKDFISTTDTIVSNDDIYSILDHIDSTFVYQSDSNQVLSISIISDTLLDGQSIRIPLSKIDCKTDQNGSPRLAYTCPGSVEGDCFVRKAYPSSIDTLSFGKPYYGRVPASAGLQIHTDTLKSVCGGDSIVYRKIMVVPNLNRQEYFVKDQKSGSADGSSWENAMNDTLFSYVLANVKANATFHIAEGKYMPYHNGKTFITDAKSRSFSADKTVRIIGGYSKDVKSANELPNPSKYTTLFTNEADEFGNSYKLFNIASSANDSVEISGITFCIDAKNPNGETLLSNSTSANEYLSVEQCTFKDASQALSANGLVSVKNSRFVNDKSVSDTLASPKCMKFNGCEFNSTAAILSATESVLMTNTTFINGNLSVIAPSVSLYNNTLLAESVKITGDVESKIVGNILENIVCSDVAIKNCKYNLSLQDLGGTNITADDLSDVLTYDFGTKQYSMVNNGNYTYSVEIFNDTLSDGNVIKFPLVETVVAEDQWGRARMAKTRIGALESLGWNCEIVEIYAEKTDTIYCDSTIYGETLHHEGEFDVVEELYTADGCDSVIHHKVIVVQKTGIENIVDNNEDLFSTDNEIFIYNVQGILLFHSRNGWNGLINRVPAPAGVYVYSIISKDGIKKNGKIEIKQ